MARAPLLVLLLAAALALAGSAVATSGSDGSGERIDALLTLDEHPDEALLDALRARGLVDVEAFDVAPVVAADGTPAQLEAAARLGPVLDVQRSQPLESHLAESRDTVNADHVYEEQGLTGAGVTVAVVDSGIDADHPAFDDRVDVGRAFDESGSEPSWEDTDGHGTHIAGTVAGSGARSDGGSLRGLAPGARLAGLDISDPFTTENAIRAFEWIHDNRADHDIRVVVNSWGRAHDEARYDEDDPLVRASNGLVQDGIVVVFSAGNKGPDDSSLTVEAMNPNVLAVGATDDQGRVEDYSSRGPAVGEDGQELDWTKPDLVAPGTDITSTRTRDGDDGSPTPPGENPWYVTMNGTSMAAPHVAATAALLLEERPSLTPKAVEVLLQASARDRGADGPDPAYGHGLLDTRLAVRALAVAEEGRAVVETRHKVPVEDDGEATGGQGKVVASGQRFHSRPRDGVTSSFEVPSQAESANLSFSWEDERTSFDVTLEHGHETVGPFHPEPGSTHVWANVSLPEKGTWTLRAEPEEPTRTRWSVDGHVTVVETQVVEGARGVLETNPDPFGGGSYFDDGAGRGAVLDDLGQAVGVAESPTAAGLTLASLLSGLWMRVRSG